MAWHGSQQYDPAAAFIKNARQQKLLDLRLDDIEKLWFAQLKHLAKDRLDVTKELTQLEEEKRQLQHYDKTMLVSDLKKYTDGVIEQFRKVNRENTRDNFNFNTSAIKEKRLSISLPGLDQVGLNLPRPPTIKHVPHRPSTKRSTRSVQRQRKLSVSTTCSNTLQRTRLKSMSDSNLHKITSFPEPRGVSSSAHVTTRRKDDRVTSRFPPINTSKLSSAKSEDHRYLKHRMATTLELPPVIEVSNHRKMSV